MNRKSPEPIPISRRAFLATLAAAPLAARRPPVVDAHMHVWTDDLARFPISHPYDPDFKLPPITGSVEMLKRFRAQGLIDPTDTQVANKLAYWMQERGFAGMRFSPIYYQGRDEWLTSEAHRQLWKTAERLGAIFNFFIAANQLARLETMIAGYPEVKVVIDHLARVNLGSPDPAAEIAQLTRLARYPNVWVKVSELCIISPSKSYPYVDTFPWVKRVFEAFGPDRLLWGTGFPGTTRGQAERPSLEQELALIRQEIPFFSKSDREKILGRNAARLWQFGV